MNKNRRGIGFVPSNTILAPAGKAENCKNEIEYQLKNLVHLMTFGY